MQSLTTKGFPSSLLPPSSLNINLDLAAPLTTIRCMETLAHAAAASQNNSRMRATHKPLTHSLAFTLPGACPESQGTQARATVGLNKCPAGVKSPDTDLPTIAPSKQNQFGRPDSLAIKLKQGRKEGLNYSTNCDGRGCTFRHLAKHFSLKSLLSPTQFQGNVPQTLQPTEMHQTLLVTEHRYTSEKQKAVTVYNIGAKYIQRNQSLAVILITTVADPSPNLLLYRMI